MATTTLKGVASTLSRHLRGRPALPRSLCTGAAASRTPPALERWPFAESAERCEALKSTIADLREEGEQFSAARLEGVKIAATLHAMVRAPWSYATSASYREQAAEKGAEDAAFLLRTLDKLLTGVDDVYIQLALDWAQGEARISELESAGALESEIGATLRSTRALYSARGLVPWVRVEDVRAEVICLDSDTTWSRTTAHVLVSSTERFAAVPLVKPAGEQAAQDAAPNADGAAAAAPAAGAELDTVARARAEAAALAEPAIERQTLLTFAGRWHSFGHYLRWVRAMRAKSGGDGTSYVLGPKEPEDGDEEPGDEDAPHPIEWTLRDVNLLTVRHEGWREPSEP